MLQRLINWIDRHFYPEEQASGTSALELIVIAVAFSLIVILYLTLT